VYIYLYSICVYIYICVCVIGPDCHSKVPRRTERTKEKPCVCVCVCVCVRVRVKKRQESTLDWKDLTSAGFECRDLVSLLFTWGFSLSSRRAEKTRGWRGLFTYGEQRWRSTVTAIYRDPDVTVWLLTPMPAPWRLAWDQLLHKSATFWNKMGKIHQGQAGLKQGELIVWAHGEEIIWIHLAVYSFFLSIYCNF